MPIAIVKAESVEDAVRITSGKNRRCPKLAAKIVASVGNIDVWPNQQLRALPATKASLNHWYEVSYAAVGLNRRRKLSKQILSQTAETLFGADSQ
jgi:hypothetical protein